MADVGSWRLAVGNLANTLPRGLKELKILLKDNNVGEQHNEDRKTEARREPENGCEWGLVERAALLAGGTVSSNFSDGRHEM